MSADDEHDGRLRELGARTEDLRPTIGLSDAVARAIDAQRTDGLVTLARRRHATEDVRPSANFTDQVMRRLDPPRARAARRSSRQRSIGHGITRTGVVAVIASALAAAACVALSVVEERDLDEDVMATVEAIEVDE